MTSIPQRHAVVRSVPAMRRIAVPTTLGFASLSDHERLPWRFFGRFTAAVSAGLSVG